ncbi:MAG: UDP-N-acetylmuramoyl-L-alanine--D-glutamate ligase [Deinococcales bacterium]
MTVLVYGLGRSGLAATRLLASQGHAIEVFDARRQGPDIDAARALGARVLSSAPATTAALCIAAPGVPIDHPDLRRLRERGVEIIGEVEWVARTVPATLVGVTGTAGKGTVTRWIADTLAGAGVDAVAGGNIDPALSAVARPHATLVVELSSFQLERCPTLRPRVAVALNLGEDHIDRHGSVAAYHDAKRNIIRHQQPDDAFVYNADDPVLRAWAQGATARTLGFSLTGPADAAFDRRSGDLSMGGEPLVPADALRVRGEHQIANALAVALACRELGLSEGAIAAGLAAFPGLPGRYQAIGSIGRVAFIDDSIATRPLAVAAALNATPAPVVWIAGGRAKGASIDALRPLVRERVSLLVGIGEAGPAFAAAFAADTETRVCHDADGRSALACAVAVALEHLHAREGGSGRVLLAPLATSFDQFADYVERARLFREVVAEAGDYVVNAGEEDVWTASS